MEKEPLKPSHLLSDLSTKDAAKRLNVSEASIKNWVKAGELTRTKTGLITAKSLLFFTRNIAGTSRLIQRANKLYQAGTPPHSQEKLIKSEALSQAYENTLSPSYRNREGIYYTPAPIIDSMLASLPEDVSNFRFFDPCCGTGNFLLGALRRGFKPHNIYGQDCDPRALSIAKTRMERETGHSFSNLNCGDFLSHDFVKEDTAKPETLKRALSKQTLSAQQPYDVIATNPPWGKKYTRAEKLNFAKYFGLNAPIGSAALFSLNALKQLKQGGYCALLLPESCSNISTFEPLRQHFLTLDIIALTDHGRPFKGLLTRAHSIVLRNASPSPDQKIECTTHTHQNQNNKLQVCKRTQKSFTTQPKLILNFQTTPQDQHVLDHIYNQPHLTLKDKGHITDKVQWGLGIVTGQNKTYCRAKPNPGDVPIFRGADILKTGLKAPTHFIDPDISQYRQAAPKALYYAREKLIYKFISDRLVFHYDTKQSLILNSANMLILPDTFPVTHWQLAFLFNTDLMTFLFRKMFVTRKVLRSDLETLPIFHTFFDRETDLTEETLLKHLGLKPHGRSYQILDA